MKQPPKSQKSSQNRLLNPLGVETGASEALPESKSVLANISEKESSAPQSKFGDQMSPQQSEQDTEKLLDLRPNKKTKTVTFNDVEEQNEDSQSPIHNENQGRN